MDKLHQRVNSQVRKFKTMPIRKIIKSLRFFIYCWGVESKVFFIQRKCAELIVESLHIHVEKHLSMRMVFSTQ